MIFEKCSRLEKSEGLCGRFTLNGISWDSSPQPTCTMLYWSLVFLVVAIIAGVLGFGGVAGAAAGIAQILFFVFLVFLVISLVMGLGRGSRTRG